MIQNRMHLLSDRHFHSMRARELQCSLRSKDSFCNHAMHARNNFRQLASATQLDANAAITRKSASAGKDQIAKSRQARHGFGSAPASYCQPGDLSQSTSDERSHGIMS